MDGAYGGKSMHNHTSTLWSDYPTDDDPCIDQGVQHTSPNQQHDPDNDGGGWTVVRHKKWKKQKSKQ